MLFMLYIDLQGRNHNQDDLCGLIQYSIDPSGQAHSIYMYIIYICGQSHVYQVFS